MIIQQILKWLFNRTYHRWVQLNGPSVAVFDDPSKKDVVIKNLVAGSYTFRYIQVTKRGISRFDDITVQIGATVGHLTN